MNLKAVKECADRVDALHKRMDSIESRRDAEKITRVILSYDTRAKSWSISLWKKYPDDMEKSIKLGRVGWDGADREFRKYASQYGLKLAGGYQKGEPGWAE